MTGLSRITDKILAEAREDANRKLAEADALCEELAREYATRAEGIRENLNEEARREAAEILARAKSGETMVRRNVMLEAKSARIDEAFSLARQEILNFSEERYADMMTTLLVSVLQRQAEHETVSREMYGEEDAPATDGYEVVLNEKDRARLGEKWIQSCRQRLQDIQKTLANRVALSPVTAPIDGGLIVRCGQIEINCSLQALFAQLRPEWEAKVSRKLFPDQSEKKGS